MWIVFLVAIFFFIACMIYVAQTSPSFARRLGLPVAVEGYKVGVTNVQQTVGASGTVLQYTTVLVTSRIMADVKAVPANIGDIVTHQTTLMEADASAYGPAKEAAEQAEIAAKTTVDRETQGLEGIKEVSKKGYASEVEIQEAVTALATAQEADAVARQKLAGAASDLAFTELVSPLPGNGIILSRSVNPGDRLVVDAPIFSIGDLDKVYFVAQVEEEMSPYINKTAPAEVVFSSFPSQTFHGIIEKVEPTVNDRTRTFQAYIAIDNPQLLLKPGITGFARISLARTALAVPDAAVMNQFGENASVFVVNGNSRAVLTPVRLGLHGSGGYEILSGLQEGDVVVTAGTAYLTDNESVHVTLRK